MTVSLKKSAFPKSLCCSSMLECLIRMSSNTSVFIVTHFHLYRSVLSSPFHYTCAAFNYFIIVIVIIIILLSWSSSVSIVSGYRLNDRISVSSRGKRIFHLASLSRPNLRPIQHPLQWVPGVLFRGGGSLAGAWRRPLIPSSAEVKNK
jgi:hypothetical protein